MEHHWRLPDTSRKFLLSSHREDSQTLRIFWNLSSAICQTIFVNYEGKLSEKESRLLEDSRNFGATVCDKSDYLSKDRCPLLKAF